MKVMASRWKKPHLVIWFVEEILDYPFMGILDGVQGVDESMAYIHMTKLIDPNIIDINPYMVGFTYGEVKMF